MCGITGVWNLPGRVSADELEQSTRQMTQQLVHRGPDDSGVWCDAARGVGLGHRRLSIVDLSAAGHQPMMSACGRYTMIYNGEFYNHRLVRNELAARGIAFRGTSDTEVLLAAISVWGLDETLSRVNGMFAIALWDHARHELTLVRDRLGIKPVYYGVQRDVLLFGSELKALRAHSAFQAEIDRSALTLFLRSNYIPAPLSIYQGICKLPPGTCVTFSRGNEGTGPLQSRLQPYWDALEIAERKRNAIRDIAPDEVVTELHDLLYDAVGLRMEADVPLGAFLSGGIDSSTIVALMQAQSSRPIQTFSMGFDQREFDEAAFARTIAEHLKTDHHEHYVSSQQARDVIPLLPTMFDEPFADSSQIPTFLVSQLARRHVTVSLSGDGGDELFGGYSRYETMAKLWSKIGGTVLPAPLRRAAAWAIRCGVPRTGGGRLFRKARTAADFLEMDDRRAMYLRLNTHWKHPEDVVLGGILPHALLTDADQVPRRDEFFEEMMLVDAVTYLPDDILTKVDRASMAVSLEARVPLLDYRVYEWSWGIPFESKVRAGEAKWPLRRVLERYVPLSLFDRPKVGFGVPLETWLRGPLRDWAEDLLEERKLTQQGFFRPQPIRQLWEDHLSGRNDWHYYLWDVLMFQAWWADVAPAISK